MTPPSTNGIPKLGTPEFAQWCAPLGLGAASFNCGSFVGIAYKDRNDDCSTVIYIDAPTNAVVWSVSRCQAPTPFCARSVGYCIPPCCLDRSCATSAALCSPADATTDG